MRDLKINVPKGYEIDKDKSTFENIVFKEIDKLPSSWEELHLTDGYYHDFYSYITFLQEDEINKENTPLFKTKKQAEASIALAQLSQLRDLYRQGWEPDWSNEYEEKHCIIFNENDILMIINYRYMNQFLSFQDKETAELFLKNFKDLIKKAKPLMS